MLRKTLNLRLRLYFQYPSLGLTPLRSVDPKGRGFQHQSVLGWRLKLFLCLKNLESETSMMFLVSIGINSAALRWSQWGGLSTSKRFRLTTKAFFIPQKPWIRDSDFLRHKKSASTSLKRFNVERETGFEPAAPTLARSCSTSWATLAYLVLKNCP